MRWERSDLDHHPFKREASSVGAGFPFDPLSVPDVLLCQGHLLRVTQHSNSWAKFMSSLFSSEVRHGRWEKTDSTQTLLMSELRRRFWAAAQDRREKPPRGLAIESHAPGSLLSGAKVASRCGWSSSHDLGTDELESWLALHWLTGLAAMRGKERCGAGSGPGRHGLIGSQALCNRPLPSSTRP
jgi:hypothetical protein